jgi:hypothetical protein
MSAELRWWAERVTQQCTLFQGSFDGFILGTEPFDVAARDAINTACARADTEAGEAEAIAETRDEAVQKLVTTCAKLTTLEAVMRSITDQITEGEDPLTAVRNGLTALQRVGGFTLDYLLLVR